MAVKKDDLKDMAKTYVAMRGAMHHSDKQRKQETDTLKEELRKEREDHKRQLEELKQEQRTLQKKSEIAVLLSSPTGQKELRKNYLGIINTLKSSVAPRPERIEMLASQRLTYDDSEIFQYVSQHLSEFLRKNPEIVDAIKIRDRFYLPEKDLSNNSVLKDVYKPYEKLLSVFKAEQNSKKMQDEFNVEANNYIHEVLCGTEKPNLDVFKLSNLKRINKKNIALAKGKIDFKAILLTPYTIVTLILVVLFFFILPLGLVSEILIIVYIYKTWKKIRTLSTFKKRLLAKVQ